MATLLKERPTSTTPRRHTWEVQTVRRNVGGTERGMRFGVGAASAIGIGLVSSFALQAVLGIVAAAGLITALTGYCPGNYAMGRDSFHKGLAP